MESMPLFDMTELGATLPNGVSFASKGEMKERTLVMEVPEECTDAQMLQLRWPGCEFEKRVLEQRLGSVLEWKRVESKLDKLSMAWRLGAVAARHTFQHSAKRSLVQDRPVIAVGISEFAAVVLSCEAQDSNRGTFYYCKLGAMTASSLAEWQRLPIGANAFYVGCVVGACLYYVDGSLFKAYDMAVKKERFSIDINAASGRDLQKRVFQLKVSNNQRTMVLLCSDAFFVFEQTVFAPEFCGECRAEPSVVYSAASAGDTEIIIGTTAGVTELWERRPDVGYVQIDAMNFLRDGTSTESGKRITFNAAKTVMCLAHRGTQHMILSTPHDTILMNSVAKNVVALTDVGPLASIQLFGDLVCVLKSNGLLSVLNRTTGRVLVSNTAEVTSVYRELMTSNGSMVACLGNAVIALLPGGLLSAIYCKLKE
jgi:hypothetical protein